MQPVIYAKLIFSLFTRYAEWMHHPLKLNFHSLLATPLDTLYKSIAQIYNEENVQHYHTDSFVFPSPIGIPIGPGPVSYKLFYSWWVIDDCWVFVTFMREEREAASGALLLELFLKLLRTKKTPISHLIITMQNTKQEFWLRAKYTQFSDRHLTWDLHFNCASKSLFAMQILFILLFTFFHKRLQH